VRDRHKPLTGHEKKLLRRTGTASERKTRGRTYVGHLRDMTFTLTEAICHRTG
jgi:hypothetical protein